MTRLFFIALIFYQGFLSILSSIPSRFRNHVVDAVLILGDLVYFVKYAWFEEHGGPLFAMIGAFFGMVLAVGRALHFFLFEFGKKHKSNEASKN